MELRSAVIATLSDDADGVCASQTPGGAGNLTIAGALASGGVATIAAAQKITITSAGDDSGAVFTITGTDADGTTITEAVTGANAGAAVSTKYFKTVTQVAIDGAAAGAVTVGPVGSNGAVSATISGEFGEYGDDWMPLISGNLTGAGTIAVEACPEDRNDTFTSNNSVQTEGSWVADTTFTGKTADFQSKLVAPAKSLRLKFTAWTSGGATFRVLERAPV